MRDIFSVPVEHESEPRLTNALVASALLHIGLGVALAIFLIQLAIPVEEPLRVTWIEPIAPPKKMELPGGSSGPVPKPVVKPRPPPRPVVVKERPKPPVNINPLAEKKAPAPPSINSVSAFGSGC